LGIKLITDARSQPDFPIKKSEKILAFIEQVSNRKELKAEIFEWDYKSMATLEEADFSSNDIVVLAEM